MATAPNLPGSQLPLNPVVQAAVDAFNANLDSYIRQATLLVLFDDLQEDIRKALKDRSP
jgi:hypothetical protein